MTLDELNTLFDAAVSRSILSNREDLPEKAHRRAGLKAVVEAIRDEVKGERGWGLDLLDCEMIFDEILASDGVKPEGSE